MCITCWKRHRYNTDDATRDKAIISSKKYRDSHPEIITAQTAQRFNNDTCRILTEHFDEHQDDDDRLTTNFIADQLKKFKDKIYDDDDLELLEH